MTLLKTLADAHDVNPYELARLFADSYLPIRLTPGQELADGDEERTVDHELHRLTVMTALQTWLTRWHPGEIQTALEHGATLDQVTAATGQTHQQIIAEWRTFDEGQRALWLTYPDIDRTPQHDRVAAILRDADPEG